jgi:signal transduction histidine kinase
MSNDATKLRQTLFNLLGNAAKFTRDGEIAVTARPGAEPDTIAFTVHDTGIGIPADRLARIFDEFEQGDGSVARAYGGTGLGLTLAQRFCRLMGGEIAVESEEGRGTTFTVTLPREYQGTREAALTVVTTGEGCAGEADADEAAAS